MKERPILFSAPMVRAILAGTKTQTRRVVKPQPVTNSAFNRHVALGFDAWSNAPNGENCHFSLFSSRDATHAWEAGNRLRCPYGVPGNALWIRETFHPGEFADPPGWLYRATDPGWDDNDCGVKWKPSIHMPRWASRLTLEVVSVRVERLQDISDYDVHCEGLTDCFRYDIDGQPWIGVGKAEPRRVHAYRALWEKINGPGSWAQNPWVWVVEFRTLTAPVAKVAAGGDSE